jgi:hypothetical protein
MFVRSPKKNITCFTVISVFQELPSQRKMSTRAQSFTAATSTAKRAPTPPRRSSFPTSERKEAGARHVVFQHEIEIFEAELQAATNGQRAPDGVRDILGRPYYTDKFVRWISEANLTRHSNARTCVWTLMSKLAEEDSSHDELDSLDFYIAAFARQLATTSRS